MKTLLDAVRETGAGDAIKLQSPQSNHGVEILTSGTGTWTSLTIALEGSISGSVYSSIGATTATLTVLNDGGLVFTIMDQLVSHVRANVTDIQSGSQATTTMTIAGAVPASGATFSIDGRVYCFQTASLATDGFILTHANASSLLTRIATAIGTGGGAVAGQYNCIEHASVSTAATTAATLILFADAFGLPGNDIILGGNGATLAFTAGTMANATERGEVTINYDPYPTL